MSRRITVFAMIVAVSVGVNFAGSGATWSYVGKTAPEHWGDLSPLWAGCSIGHYQSPIDINATLDAKLGGVSADVNPTPLVFGLDGPTFAVEYDPGSWITVNNTRYEIKQFHFHHQSEHTLNGKHFPMEGHVVLRAEESDHANAVMGVFIEAGKENGMLAQFWGQLPRSKNKNPDPVKVNVGDLLPAKRHFYMYEGSMTTPGCTQGVRWFIFEEPVQASQAQIDLFIEDLTQGETNNRPIQQTFGRVVLKGK